MRILITGATGLLGQNLYFHFKNKADVWGLWHNTNSHQMNGEKITLEDKTQIQRIFQEYRPDICLHSAAISDPEFCERHRDIAYRVNLLGTQNIAEICFRFQTRLVFFSTNYVFNGQDESYSEDSSPCPLQYYGETKARGEEFVKQVPDSIILRLSLLYGSYPIFNRDSFIGTVLKYLDKGEKLELDNERIRFPLLCNDVVKMVDKLLQQKEKGIFHLSGSTSVTKYLWGCLISNICYGNCNLIYPQTSELFLYALRPKEVKLETKKLFLKLTSIQKGTLKIISHLQE
jgi:dTDP-4-dehydrorhamnose reductase